jgi:hypothetical protein
MRRTIFLALVAALLLVPAAAHAATDPIKIIRDCEDDGVLQGNYSPSELRKARSELPTDIDEYSDCRDVLSRAISGDDTPNDGSGSTGGGSSTGNGSDTNAGGAAGTPTPTPRPQGRGPGDVPMLETQDDWQAVDQAAKHGDRALETGATPLSPGTTRLAADVGRNRLPGSLVAVLALLGAAALSAGAPLIRRRVIARRQP